MDSPYVRTILGEGAPPPLEAGKISTEDHRALEFLGFRFTHCGGGNGGDAGSTFDHLFLVSLPLFDDEKATAELLMDKVLHQLIQSIFNYFCKGFNDPKGCGDESLFDCFVDP